MANFQAQVEASSRHSSNAISQAKYAEGQSTLDPHIFADQFQLGRHYVARTARSIKESKPSLVITAAASQ